jgi:uncharacterized protein
MKKSKGCLLFELGHPKHYHMFKRIMRHYSNNGNKIKVIARNKDILLKLLEADGVGYITLGPYRNGILNKILITPLLLFNYIVILLKNKPHTILSKASPYASVFSKYFGIRHIMFPDSDGFKSNDILMKYADIIITPDNYTNNYGEKHKRIHGFFENLYLHPGTFKPDANVLKKYSIDQDSKYVIVRFVGWGAHHDTWAKGIHEADREKIITSLSRYADVYITSEFKLNGALSNHKLRIAPEDIHHVLYYSSLYIGDSQTMATEASLLGVPAIRTNTFVGENDMSNFKVLENEYGLLFNYSDASEALNKAVELLQDDDIKPQWKERREKYYESNRDVFKQIIEIMDGVG